MNTEGKIRNNYYCISDKDSSKYSMSDLNKLKSNGVKDEQHSICMTY